MLAGEELLIEGAWLAPGASSAGARPLMHDHGVTFPDEVRYGPAGRDFLDEHHMYPTLDARPSSARNREARFDRTYRLPFDPNCTARDEADAPPILRLTTAGWLRMPRLAPRRARRPSAHLLRRQRPLRRSSHLRPVVDLELSLARTPRRRRRRAAPPTNPSSASPSSLSARARALFFFDLEIDLYVGDAPRGDLDAARARDEDEGGGEREEEHVPTEAERAAAAERRREGATSGRRDGGDGGDGGDDGSARFRGRAPASPFHSDGVWICFSDLTAAMVGPLIVDGNSGSGLCLLLCPGEPPRRGAPGARRRAGCCTTVT